MEQRGRGMPYRSLFWPVILIGVGVIWLLANMEILEPIAWYKVLNFWPLLLIAIGLDVIIGRRSAVIGGLVGLGAVAIFVLLLLMAPGLDIGPDLGELKTLNFSEPLNGAKSASIDLDLERYSTTVEALVGSSALIEAELDTFTDVDFMARGKTDKTVTLQPSLEVFTPDWNLLGLASAQAEWEIGLSPDVPIDLTVDGGSGSVSLDLETLELTDLVVDGGSGSFVVSLPASMDQYSVAIDGGSGSFRIEVAEGADIDADFEVGSGSFTLQIAGHTNFGVKIDGGSGSIVIDVPSGAAVRVVVEDSGSGSVFVPSSYTLVSDGGDDDRDTGVWETEGFDGAPYQIEITFDGGSGSFSVR